MSNENSNELLIVGLGGSAGGIEALEEFFNNMPADSGIAFVIVQHLSPDHTSALAEVLARHTRMSVEQARDNVKVLGNRVYIIPPDATLTVENSTLHVSSPTEPRGQRKPIDSLFRSLAEDRGENAVCIMLSGTGTDGTLGLIAIKGHGGMALAQNIETAKYDAILRSAIATGLVDHVLPVEEMAPRLLEYAAHLGTLNGNAAGIREQLGANANRFYKSLRRSSGHDFSQYKESTVVRRMERRMKAAQIETVAEYVELLENRPDEVGLLLKDLLISVTQFFRDPKAFEVLERDVIPQLFSDKQQGDTVRVCVVGCATGEEAYSIGILLCEYAASLANPPALQIFATDIDERGLGQARKGRYPESIAEDITSERLERFFTKEEGTYQVTRELRKICLFSSHSFIKDPPFSRLDLISCRNVMIYLGADLQRKVLPLFHYALRPGGHLFLGPSESIASHIDLFRTVDKKHRIFVRNEDVGRLGVQFPIADNSALRPHYRKPPKNEETSLKQIERLVLEKYSPACAVVRQNGDAVYFSSRITRYLEQPAGSPESNVIHLAPEDLRIPLRTSLHKAVMTHERIVQRQISIEASGVVSRVDLIVEPLPGLPDSGLYMIVLEELAGGSRAEPAADAAFDASARELLRRLESELQASQEQAQAAHEELEAANEELQSANEEYQSTNEELETSKEELQSFNEELETVNSELNRNVAELDHANSDLQNLLNSTQLATIFLDPQLRIRNFTPAAGSVFRLIPGDIGRPITDLAAHFTERDVTEDFEQVLRTLAAKERHLTGAQGRHYLMRALPYRDTHNVIDGVVITFTDVTQLQKVEKQAHEAQLFAENIVDTIREPLLVLNAALKVITASKSFYKAFHVTAADIIDRPLFEIGNAQWDIPELRRLISELLPECQTVEGFEVRRAFGQMGPSVLLLNARQIDHVPLILLAFEDITERKREEDVLRRLNEDLRHFSFAASHDLQEPLRMVMSYTQLLARQYKGKLDAQADQFIAYAVQGAERMESLLRDLREYWSVNEQKLVAPSPVDCRQVLEKSLENLSLAIRESQAIVTHDPLPTVMAEETPLLQLFQNLIGNAFKYHQIGLPPRIHVHAERSGNYWNFSVRDNGIGIKPEHAEMIFAPFKRLHGAEYSGSGLGLAISRRVVERYGGRIWMESEAGLGSTFCFTIPIPKIEEESL